LSTNAGDTTPIYNAGTGEVWPAALFVAVLGASSYTYAEASLSQGLADWIGAHMRAFEFMGGVPEIVVPDNLKSGVTRACRYEPSVNRTYEEMAAHYSVAVVPARPLKPRDKAKVEAGGSGCAPGGTLDLGRPTEKEVLHPGRAQPNDFAVAHQAE
jgi:transposase